MVGKVVGVSVSSCREIAKPVPYRFLLIDNPMTLRGNSW